MTINARLAISNVMMILVPVLVALAALAIGALIILSCADSLLSMDSSAGLAVLQQLAVELGADDYIEKPFSPRVMVAKVQAVLSRMQRGGRKSKMDTISIGDVSLNTKSRRVFCRGREVDLKNMEYELLHFLMSNPDEVFSRENLYEYVWGMDKDGDNSTVVVHINRLREKLEEDPSRPRHIQTVWGAGYRFSAR